MISASQKGFVQLIGGKKESEKVKKKKKMPRPGPRPYECVKRAWHSDRHKPIRGSLIQEIFRFGHFLVCLLLLVFICALIFLSLPLLIAIRLFLTAQEELDVVWSPSFAPLPFLWFAVTIYCCLHFLIGWCDQIFISVADWPMICIVLPLGRIRSGRRSSPLSFWRSRRLCTLKPTLRFIFSIFLPYYNLASILRMFFVSKWFKFPLARVYLYIWTVRLFLIFLFLWYYVIF